MAVKTKSAGKTKPSAKKVAKKAPVKKAPAKKTAVKKVAKKAPVKKVAKKAPAKKAPIKKVAKKAPEKKAPIKKVAKKVAKKAPVKKAVAKAPVKKATPKSEPKPAASKPAAPKKSVSKVVEVDVVEPVVEVVEPPAPPVVKKFGNVVPMPKKKVKPVPGITKVISPRPSSGPKVLVVREDESPWTKSELNEIRKALNLDETRLLEEIEMAEAGLADLIRDSGDGAGDDQADAGSKTFEREHEMSLANNAREMVLQVRHALGRIDDGSYGVCEGCGKAIGKLRLQAFPRATLCMACKVAEERI